MRPWASWAAKTAAFSLTAGLAATAGGLPGVALAASGSTASGQVAAQAAPASDVCNDAGVLLGIVGAACQSVALPGSPAAAPVQAGQSAAGTGRGAASQGSSQGTSGQGTSGQGTARGSGQGPARASGRSTAQGSGRSLDVTVGQVVQRAVAPLTAVISADGSAPALGTVPALTPLTAVTGAPSSQVTGTADPSAAGTDRTGSNPPAARAGDTNVPAATQLAGLGALPGLADLPSSAGLASTPARNGAQGGGISMPGTALSAASSGMSSDSFAALAVGALLAGASALKIAGRRARDRKAGIGVAL
jgi:hypothetical protein